MAEDVLDQMAAVRLVPVVVLDEPTQADPLAQALVTGGLPVAEVTFRTNAAASAIETMANRGDILVGAGTVLTAEQVDAAVDAGASYIVSPGFSAEVVRRCQQRGVLALPGAVTATEIQAAIAAGLQAVKFFPAEASGGAKAIKALSAPFADLKFVPTGGVNASNLAEYTALSSVLAIGGSWMVPRTAINAGDFETITTLSREAVALATA